MDFPQLKSFEISGDVSIESVGNGQVVEPSCKFIIMGPTGAGKSSFIEALAGETQSLSISKDQLAGCTQKVTAYLLTNVAVASFPIYLIDTPGFSDSKISEKEIIDMIRKWIRDNNLAFVNRVLFLTPITDTRVAGSKRKTISMLKALMERSLDSVIFVSTMWDTLHNEQTRQRAESNFAQLRDEILKASDFNLLRASLAHSDSQEFIDKEADIVRFMNTKASALQILEMCYSYLVEEFYHSHPCTLPNFYQDLHERIEVALQNKRTLEAELGQPETRNNLELRSLLEKNHRENEETLTKFIGQLHEFRPAPAGYEDAYNRLEKSIQVMQQVGGIEEDPGAPAVEQSTSSMIQQRSSRLLTFKGLTLRFTRAAKRSGKKLFQKS